MAAAPESASWPTAPRRGPGGGAPVSIGPIDKYESMMTAVTGLYFFALYSNDE